MSSRFRTTSEATKTDMNRLPITAVIVGLLAFVANSAADSTSSQGIVALEGLRPNSSYLVTTGGDGSVTAVRPITVFRVGDPTPAPPPVTPGSLQSWVVDSLKAIPAHKNREESQAALAGIYKVLGEQLAAGKIQPDDFREVRMEAVERVLVALGTKDQWTDFDIALQQEMARRQLTQSQMPDALLEISEGLSAGQALNPEVIQAALKVVLALISKDKAAVVQAILEFVTLLISQRVGG